MEGSLQTPDSSLEIVFVEGLEDLREDDDFLDLRDLLVCVTFDDDDGDDEEESKYEVNLGECRETRGYALVEIEFESRT